jgi:hypothetical protein
MQTIEPVIQETILKALPADGQLAKEVMCQLLANMILSIPNSTVDEIVERLRFHLAAYEGT